MIRITLLATASVVTLVASIVTHSVGQSEGTGARSLFAGTSGETFGVHYWIELEGTGPVTESRRFVTAERIVMHVRSNTDGFLAVWVVNAQGGADVLLPPDAARPIALRAGETKTTPPIRFRPPAIDEQLIIGFARSQAELPAVGSVADASALLTLARAGTRDLIMEVNEATRGGLGTYLVRRTAGPIVRELRLRHVRP